MADLKKKKKAGRGASKDGGSSLFGFWPRLALLVLTSVALIVGLGWLWRGAWPRAQRTRVQTALLETSGELGFKVRQVVVEGRVYTDKKNLLDALGVKEGQPILGFDPHGAHARLAALPWTRSVIVVRVLPDKIAVKLTERKPFARWQKKDKTVVVDADGAPLDAARVELFGALPLIVGDVAPEQTREFLDLLSSFPDIAQRLKGAVRVSERRWNVHLTPDVTVRLPENGVRAAMERLSALMEEKKILDLDVKTIDLRLLDKIYIEPVSPEVPSE